MMNIVSLLVPKCAARYRENIRDEIICASFGKRPCEAAHVTGSSLSRRRPYGSAGVLAIPRAACDNPPKGGEGGWREKPDRKRADRSHRSTSRAGDIRAESNFRAQKPLAEEGWQLIVPDRPGHGRSPDPGRPDDAEADGAWVAALLEDGAHLVGHSFGGCVALAAAARRPEAVRSLTFIEPGMLSFAMSDPSVRRLVRRMIMTMIFSLSAAGRARRVMALLGIPAEIQSSRDRAALTRLGRSLRRARLPSKATLQRELDVIKDARIPLLVVSGGWNPAFEATCDRVAAAAGGRRAVIRSGHHFPQWIGGAFNPLLAGFMRESDEKRAPGR
jgi:pimeloyl-ACP methyl ester carboxylesterase